MIKENEPQHVAIFGGSFDPPHQDHARVLRWLIKESPAPLTNILVAVVGGEHPLNKVLAPYADRKKMVDAMVKAVCPSDTGTFFSALEMDKDAVKVVKQDEQFTVDFLHRLHTEYPEGTQFYLVVGTDVVNETKRWKDWDEVLEMATLLPILRQGEEVPPPPPGFAYEGDEVTEGLQLLSKWHEIKSRGFSSTQIRKQLAEGDLTHLIGDGAMLLSRVEMHIRLNNLYGHKDPDFGEPEVKLVARTFALADLEEFITKGVPFAIRGCYRKVLRVEGCEMAGTPGFRFHLVEDSSMLKTNHYEVRQWYRRQTEAWAKGKEFTDKKPEPFSPGVLALKDGHPVKEFPANAAYLGNVEDYEFFTDGPVGSFLSGLLGSL